MKRDSATLDPRDEFSYHRKRKLRVLSLGALLLIFAAASLAVGEIGARAFWSIRYHVPFRTPGLILFAYYPELAAYPEFAGPDAAQPRHDDEFYDILILGASTVSPNWIPINDLLREELAENGQPNVRVFNLAVPAHTSRDSMLKYAALAKSRFELVIVYDGANDFRANNAPPEIFKEDYSHYSWYETVNTMAPYHNNASLALPYTLSYLQLRMRQTLFQKSYVPTNIPRPEWLEYGRELRTPAAFEHNLETILKLAAERGDRVLLATFADYLPENYSDEAFKAKHLDYELYVFPIAILGRSEYVRAGIEAHNEVIRRLAAKHEHEGVIFADTARLMPRGRTLFNDPIHYTVLGSIKFVDILLDPIIRTIKRHA